jgi:hypothetical protein
MSHLPVLKFRYESDNQTLVIKLLIESEGELRDTEVRGTLSSADKLFQIQEQWIKAYRDLNKKLIYRLETEEDQTIGIRNKTVIYCQKAAAELEKALQEWLNSEQFHPLKQQLEQILKSQKTSE